MLNIASIYVTQQNSVNVKKLFCPGALFHLNKNENFHRKLSQLMLNMVSIYVKNKTV